MVQQDLFLACKILQRQTTLKSHLQTNLIDESLVRNIDFIAMLERE